MLSHLRGWTAVQRSAQANLRLGAVLCFIAGATNAGGFLAVGQYTSHMSGIVSAIADDLVLGKTVLVVSGLAALAAFMAGAVSTTWMVHWALRRQLHSAYGRPLLLEAVLLLVFGLFGAQIEDYAALFVPLTVLLLCFIMGLQNAVITKISNAEIRTTHITGLVTDLSIELGRLSYINRLTRAPEALVQANFVRLRIHALLVLCFFLGGLCGAWGFKYLGFISTLPLALALLLLVWHPLAADARQWITPQHPQD